MRFTYLEMTSNKAFESVRDGDCDVSLITAYSDNKIGKIWFTAPFAFSNTSIAVSKHGVLENSFDLIKSAINNQTIILLTMMLAGMLLFSILLVIFERKTGGSHFSGSALNGFGSALWFSAVTMTAVGYGDKTPVTLVGRCLTFFWIMFGVLVIAVLTGSVSSSLTVAQLNTGTIHMQDLANYKVGVIQNTRSYDLLNARGIPIIPYSNITEGLKSLKEGKDITAFAADGNAIRYQVSHNYQDYFRIKTIPSMELYLTFGIRKNLPYFEEINQTLAEITLRPEWHSRKDRWFRRDVQ